MKEIWFTHMEKHFQGRVWKKYYKKIMSYTFSVNLGLKPSFMWDFGPGPIIPGQISNFIQDLKNSALVSNETVVLTVGDNVFISNIPNLLKSLKQDVLFMDVTDKESDWVLCERNELLENLTDQLVQKFQGNSGSGRVSLEMGNDYCMPSVFGLLLGYPLIYYFRQKYQTLSLSLKLYTCKCKFKFPDLCENFPMYSFSVPEHLVCPAAESVVSQWFDKLNNVNRTAHGELQLEQRLMHVNSLNL